MRKFITLRHVLALTGLVLASSGLAGCGKQETETPQSKAADAAHDAYAAREAKLGARYDRQDNFFRLKPLDDRLTVRLESIRNVCSMFGMTYQQHTIAGKGYVEFADVVCNKASR